MGRELAVIGAPTSVGAYAPGTEKAPSALRRAGLMKSLQEAGLTPVDLGDISARRWRTDPNSRLAMNVSLVADAAADLAAVTRSALERWNFALVMGGDCTIEMGVVAAAPPNCGLVYIDLDADLNTPATTADGALDWMGVAHMLAVRGSVPELQACLGPPPLLDPARLYFLGHDGIQQCEAELVEQLRIANDPLSSVVGDPCGSGRAAAQWGRRFDHVLVHLDVDILNFADTPIAENTRRRGLEYDQLLQLLSGVFDAGNIRALTIAEVNPDHCDSALLSRFVRDISGIIANSAIWIEEAVASGAEPGGVGS